MKRILSLYTSWRNDVLMAMTAAVLILVCAESDNMMAFAMSKLAAAMLAVLLVMLFKYWDGKGKLKDLNDFINKD